MTAIGTSNSVICVFDPSEKWLKSLGGAKEQAYGSVTSLDINKEADSLISGYEHGEIVLWDLASGLALKNVFGVHESAVINIQFYTPGRSKVISCDARGRVFILQIKRVLFSYTVDKKLLLERNVGPTLSLQVFPGRAAASLRRPSAEPAEFPQDQVLVALATFSTSLVISIEPEVKIVQKIPRPEYVKESSMASLAWGKGVLPGFRLIFL